ncbi:MAG: hypothetical protein FWD49_01185 [Firmicutes bacterium]|nr:hypothetical protein [Bacillota bacterium]
MATEFLTSDSDLGWFLVSAITLLIEESLNKYLRFATARNLWYLLEQIRQFPPLKRSPATPLGQKLPNLSFQNLLIIVRAIYSLLP